MLAYDRSGSGVPLVFIHAFPLSRAMWNATRDRFSKNFQVITFDMPGFGDSALTKDPITMEEMAREVLLTLNSLEIKEKMVFTGASMGGYVMFQILKQAADRVRGLVFVSTRSTPDTEDVRERRKKTIDLIKEQGMTAFSEKVLPTLFSKKGLELPLPVVAEVRQQIEQSKPEAICAALRGMALRSDSTQFLQNINVPTLVIHGADDTSLQHNEMNQMARLIPRARFESIPNAGHLLPLEQPDVFFDSFSRYLKRSVL